MSSRIFPSPVVRRRAPSLDDVPLVGSPYPISGGIYDDEFEGVSLDPKWVRTGNGGWNDTDPIDQYLGFTTGGARWSLNSFRKSWLMVQPHGNVASHNLHQAAALPNDFVIWARFSFNFRYSGVVNNDATISLRLMADSGGSPDLNNIVYIQLNESDANTVQCEAGVIVSGSATSEVSANVGPQSAGTDCLSQSACYVLISRRATAFDFWMGWPNGHWMRLTSRTFNPALAYIGLGFLNASTAAPGCMVAGVDFVRVWQNRILP